LEQLKQLKETKGKKRLDDIDGDEDVANVYDEVTEEEYAKLVAKRRKENANFVVGAEENDEYVDMGEEEDWTRENPAYRDDEGDDEDGRNNANASMDAEDEDGGAANGNTKSKKELAKEKKRKQLEKEKLKAS
jgi:hypothetical protein